MGRRTAIAYRALLVIGTVAAILSAVPTAQASKAVVGTIATLSHAESATEAPAGIAVNTTGAGGAGAGDVYVVNSPNNRVEEFSATGSFVRAFGYDTAAAGTDNTGVDEKQTVAIAATGGTFTLTTVTGATGFGDPSAGSNAITKVSTATGTFHVGDGISGCGITPGTTITAVGVESLTLSAIANFSCPQDRVLTAFETTAPIAYDATAAEVQTALDSLPELGAGSVAVGGGPGANAPLTIEFTGALAHNDLPAMTADSTELSGSTHLVTIATLVQGGGYEVCDPVLNPSDACKAGLENTAAGGMNEPNGIAIDETNGNVYVTDLRNHRVDVYSAVGAFEGAFGWDVNATSPKDELQFCTIATGCQAGSFGSGTGQLNAVQNSLPAVGPNGHLYVPDGGNSNNRIDEFAPVLNGSEEVTGVTAVGALGWNVVASGPDQSSEIQHVKVNATAGKFKLAYGADTTGQLAFNAPAKESEEAQGGPESVEKALNGLSSIDSGGGSVTVSGGPGDASGATPYAITFGGGDLAHTDVASMVATAVGLSGGSPKSKVSVETYSNGTEGLEYCVVARGDACKAGDEGPNHDEETLKLGQFSRGSPTSLAVDQSGALYAVNQSVLQNNGPALVYKFTFPAPGEVTAEEFASQYLEETTGDPTAVDPTDVAVDPETQHVLVAKGVGLGASKFFEFDSSGTLLEESPAGEAGLNNGGSAFFYNGLAIGPGGRFYFSNKLGVVDIFGPPPAPTVSIAPVTGVDAISATFHGVVKPPSPVGGTGFDTKYHFEYSVDGVNWSRFPADDVDLGDGSGSGPAGSCPVGNPPSCTVAETVTGLVPGSHYQVRLVASTGTLATSASESFETEQGAPLVSGAGAEEIGEASVKLSGSVNPANQATTYHFEWGVDAGYGNQAPVGAEGSVGSGGQPVTVSASLEGLKSGVVYHYRLVASNPSGTTVGPDREFSTFDRYGLPDGRAPEQVSPNDKRPVGMVATFLEGEVNFQAASDGNSVLYPLQNGAVDATAGGEVEYMGSRGQSGWLPTQLTPPSLVPAVQSGTADSTGHVLYASADLSCELLESFEPLTADTPEEDVAEGVTNLYRRNADGTYTLLSAPVPMNTDLQHSFHIDWASADCSHVLFDTGYTLLPEATNSLPLYEWAEGVLRLADVIPNGHGGESVTSAVAGAGVGMTTLNSMSTDGSKVFLTAISQAGADKGKNAVFVREDGVNTVDASQSQTATIDSEASYAMATPSGSHVFFLANYGLATNGSSTGASSCEAHGTGAGCDLYDYDTAARTLTDVSADTNPADARGAGVVGLLDSSDDGAYVYFAARGQLVPGKGKSEAQNGRNGSYNVYLSHEGVLSYVGPIATEDASADPFSGSDVSFGSSHWVSDATPDGKHLLFVSKANVTGYESKGVTEAYVYSAESGETVCVSCRPDGLPSVGDRFTEPITVDPQVRDGSPMETRVPNRPRSISDDGRRVFFTMPDVLAPGARSLTHNIYEWEAGQVYLLVAGEGAQFDFTRYADASANGNDVFLVTKAKLVAQDFDKTSDIYDLRVGGGFSEPSLEALPCDALTGECQGPSKPQSAEASSPASLVFSGPGNPIAVAPSCKKGYAAERGKCVKEKSAAKIKKSVSKRCRKGYSRRHGKCVRTRSTRHKRPVANKRRAAR